MLSADRPHEAADRTRSAESLLATLRREIGAYGSAVVAFSGGVDSTLVLAVAAQELGEAALGVVGLSPSLADGELEEARRLARWMGARLELVPTGEMDDPAYVANGPDRCFHCKTGLYVACRRVARERGLAVLVNGTNADDPADWRPGLRAAGEAGVRSPLVACGLGKRAVRQLARHIGLPNWDKPALACLASRLPYGTAVTVRRLQQVDHVEQHLRELGFRQVRARHHGDEVRLEVEPERVPHLLRRAGEPGLLAAVREAGFERFVVERLGYRSGRLNDGLPMAGRGGSA